MKITLKRAIFDDWGNGSERQFVTSATAHWGAPEVSYEPFGFKLETGESTTYFLATPGQGGSAKCAVVHVGCDMDLFMDEGQCPNDSILECWRRLYAEMCTRQQWLDWSFDIE